MSPRFIVSTMKIFLITALVLPSVAAFVGFIFDGAFNTFYTSFSSCEEKRTIGVKQFYTYCKRIGPQEFRITTCPAGYFCPFEIHWTQPKELSCRRGDDPLALNFETSYFYGFIWGEDLTRFNGYQPFIYEWRDKIGFKDRDYNQHVYEYTIGRHDAKSVFYYCPAGILQIQDKHMCPEGHSCDYKSKTPCPAGHYSPLGDRNCIKCNASNRCGKKCDDNERWDEDQNQCVKCVDQEPWGGEFDYSQWWWNMDYYFDEQTSVSKYNQGLTISNYCKYVPGLNKDLCEASTNKPPRGWPLGICAPCPQNKLCYSFQKPADRCPYGYVKSYESGLWKCKKCDPGQYAWENECKPCPSDKPHSVWPHYGEESCTNCLDGSPEFGCKCEQGYQPSKFSRSKTLDQLYSLKCELVDTDKRTTGLLECLPKVVTNSPEFGYKPFNGRDRGGDSYKYINVGGVCKKCCDETEDTCKWTLRSKGDYQLPDSVTNTESWETYGKFYYEGDGLYFIKCEFAPEFFVPKKYYEEPLASVQECANKTQYWNGTCEDCPDSWICNGEYRVGYCGEGQISKDNVCETCAPGTYEENRDSNSCMDCDQDYYCTNGKRHRCPPFQYSDPKAQECFNSPCDSTLYFNQTTRTCFEILPGYFRDSVNGETTQRPCQNGTFSNQNTDFRCTDCSSGRTSLAGSSSCYAICADGDYWADTDECKVCPKGHWCADNKVTPCQVSKYNPNQGAVNESACVRCVKEIVDGQVQFWSDMTDASRFGGATTCKLPICARRAGEYVKTYVGTGSLVGETFRYCADCPGNYYCPADDNDDIPKRCPPGTKSNPQSKDVADCEPFYCQNGQFPSFGYCGNCPPGWACNGVNMTRCNLNQITSSDKGSCEPCPNGTESEDNIECRTCRPGRRCANGVSEQCPTNYISQEGASECTLCSNDTLGSNDGVSCLPICNSGFVRSDDNTTCRRCEENHYCVNGTELPCANGTNSWKGKSECTTCPQGNFWNGGSGCEPCPEEIVCSENKQMPCTDGKICKEGIEFDCPANKWCLPSGSYDCPQDYSCEGGVRKQCRVGTASAEGQSNCTLCEPDTFCINGRKNDCIYPSRSLRGSSVCTVCDDGKYWVTENGCTACPEWHVCRQNQIEKCPPMSNCDTGEPLPLFKYAYELDEIFDFVCPDCYNSAPAIYNQNIYIGYQNGNIYSSEADYGIHNKDNSPTKFIDYGNGCPKWYAHPFFTFDGIPLVGYGEQGRCPEVPEDTSDNFWTCVGNNETICHTDGRELNPNDPTFAEFSLIDSICNDDIERYRSFIGVKGKYAQGLKRGRCINGFPRFPSDPATGAHPVWVDLIKNTPPLMFAGFPDDNRITNTPKGVVEQFKLTMWIQEDENQPYKKQNSGVPIREEATNLAPAFADLNGDGLYDLVLGDHDGKLYCYVNIGNSTNPIFTRMQNHPFNEIDVKRDSVPSFGDLDGNISLVVGAYDGNVYKYKRRLTCGYEGCTTQDGTRIDCCLESGVSCVLRNGVTNIIRDAFRGCTMLRRIDHQEKEVEVSPTAFDSVTTLGPKYSFYASPSLDQFVDRVNEDENSLTKICGTNTTWDGSQCVAVCGQTLNSDGFGVYATLQFPDWVVEPKMSIGLDDCVDECRRNSTCSGFNYHDGQCELSWAPFLQKNDRVGGRGYLKSIEPTPPILDVVQQPTVDELEGRNESEIRHICGDGVWWDGQSCVSPCYLRALPTDNYGFLKVNPTLSFMTHEKALIEHTEGADCSKQCIKYDHCLGFIKSANKCDLLRYVDVAALGEYDTPQNCTDCESWLRTFTH